MKIIQHVIPKGVIVKLPTHFMKTIFVTNKNKGNGRAIKGGYITVSNSNKQISWIYPHIFVIQVNQKINISIYESLHMSKNNAYKIIKPLLDKEEKRLADALNCDKVHIYKHENINDELRIATYRRKKKNTILYGSRYVAIVAHKGEIALVDTPTTRMTITPIIKVLK